MADVPALSTLADTPSHTSGMELFVAHVATDQAALDALPMALAIFDGALRLRFSNVRYRLMTGMQTDAGHARFPRTMDDVTALAAHVRTAGRAMSRVYAAHDPDGARLVEVQAVPAPVAGGRGVTVIGTDVTEREELRSHLAESVSQLTAVFDALPDAVRVYDAAGRLVRANALAEQSAPGRFAMSLKDLWLHYQPRSMSHVPLKLDQTPVTRALRGEHVVAETFIVNRLNGEATVEVNAVALRGPTGKIRGAVAIERDVTERVRLAQELEEQVAIGSALFAHVSTEADRLERMVVARSGELLRLEAARSRDRRLAALGQLAAGVMHDVNNALNPVMLAAWLLDRHAEDPEKVREYADRIQKAAETGAATASRVGRFIRQEPVSDGREARFDLAHVVADAIAIAEPTWTQRGIGSRITVERALDPGLAVEGVAGEVREAVLNLVQNALDAMPNGGMLRINVRAMQKEAWLEVEDSGIGMNDEVREQAFDPFFSTKGTAGSGLGLSEVYGIMRRHRGMAELVSVPGSGTTVRLRFPLTQGGTVEPVVPRQPWTPKRVLLVEDQPEGRRAVREVLVNAGHTVTEVNDLAQARAILGDGAFAPSVDVVVTDVFLPDGYGWELVGDVRRISSALRIGLITGWELAPPPSVNADFTLRKPLAATELLDRIAG
jgi:signal transduction histidine kinase